VLTEDMAPGIEVAPITSCALVREAASRGSDIVCFRELFLTPFFPNRLRGDYERFVLELPCPVTDPLFATVRRRAVALIFPFGEKAGRFYYYSAAHFDRTGRHLGTYRKTDIPAILPSDAKGGTPMRSSLSRRATRCRSLGWRVSASEFRSATTARFPRGRAF
jgi:predicted amidohydrolase